MAELYAWHSKAMKGLDPANDSEPKCGWFKRKLVKGGVFVPARIWMEQDIDAAGELVSDEVLRCEVNGKEVDPDDAWSWICSNPISQQEYRYLEARLAFAAAHEPTDAYADPRKSVDLLNSPILF